jgi:glycosyltransferase involved in cell wall biosynthesis
VCLSAFWLLKDKEMKIGLMLRAIDEIDGAGIATTNLIDKVIDIDRVNRYVVFYKNAKYIGRYQNYPNVKEVLIDVKSKLVYDQVMVPIYAAKEKVDLIFNTKFTVPLLTNIKSITIMRGSEYWIYPHYYDKLDLLYVNTFFPFYCRKAMKVITLSEVLRKDLHKFLKIPMEKMLTVYSAPHERFKPIEDEVFLEEVRKEFALPKEKFILSVTKPYSAVGSKSKKLYPRKNIDGIVHSFLKCKSQVGNKIKLVFLGKNVKESLIRHYSPEFIEKNDFAFPGYIPQEYMPAVYNLAELLIFPSHYESFGIPLVEAMACGCPVVTSNTGACPEIVSEAGITCCPDDVDTLADAMGRVISNEEFSSKLRQKGLARSKFFSWDRSARTILELFRSSVHGSPSPLPPPAGGGGA